ncbi:hypothetical protein THAOC_10132 [Thalassiosira oceanica]|uniref:Uncharacterized protein n=1 Tax=Thalassiosira oceanica TaxID=159749 RepID=K0T5V2_THAOC|nr:hypothetical protein THAOC_10132 [Thalassiosira oceanica]|eukprot:EJK68666.1 hypothetical protein THAOC_10132 [Thalassiosira oceanica]
MNVLIRSALLLAAVAVVVAFQPASVARTASNSATELYIFGKKPAPAFPPQLPRRRDSRVQQVLELVGGQAVHRSEVPEGVQQVLELVGGEAVHPVDDEISRKTEHDLVYHHKQELTKERKVTQHATDVPSFIYNIIPIGSAVLKSVMHLIKHLTISEESVEDEPHWTVQSKQLSLCGDVLDETLALHGIVVRVDAAHATLSSRAARPVASSSTAGRLVKFCGVDCQRAHRKQHKKACKQRVAELKDEQLYSQGHERPDGDFCPICTLPIPLPMAGAPPWRVTIKNPPGCPTTALLSLSKRGPGDGAPTTPPRKLSGRAEPLASPCLART